MQLLNIKHHKQQIFLEYRRKSNKNNNSKSRNQFNQPMTLVSTTQMSCVLGKYQFYNPKYRCNVSDGSVKGNGDNPHCHNIVRNAPSRQP